MLPQVPVRTEIFILPYIGVQVSVDGSSASTAAAKLPRKVNLTQEEKDGIMSMATPQCMDYTERKRQYAAMRRAIYKSAEPALLAKFQLSNDVERRL